MATKFVIGEDWKERYPLTEEHKAELRKKMGTDNPSGWPPYEVVIDGGKKFYRSINPDSGLNNYLESSDDEQMMCVCGGKAFEIKFDSSGVHTRCPKCGNRNEFSW